MNESAIALEIKRARKRSFRNLRGAARLLQKKPHDGLNTEKVESSSTSVVRKIREETGWSFAQIEEWANKMMGGQDTKTS